MKRFCKTCGAEIGEGTNVCSICGSVYGEAAGNETTVLNQNNPFNAAPQSAAQQNYAGKSPAAQNPTAANNSHFQNPYQNHQNPSGSYGQPASSAQSQAPSAAGPAPAAQKPAQSGQYYAPPVQNAGTGYQNGANYPYASGNVYQQSQPAKKQGKAAGIIIGVVVGVIALIAVVAIVLVAMNGASESSDADSYESSYFDEGEFTEEEIEISYGSFDGMTYSNPSMGFSFDLPSESWSVFQGQQLLDNLGPLDGYELSLDESNHVTAKNIGETVHYDFYAIDSVNGVILYTFFSEPSIINKDMEVDDYVLANVNAELDSSDPNYATEADIYSCTIAGKEYRACDTVMDISGVTFNLTFAVRKAGDYFCCVGVANSREFDTYSTTYYLNMFY